MADGDIIGLAVSGGLEIVALPLGTAPEFFVSAISLLC